MSKATFPAVPSECESKSQDIASFLGQRIEITLAYGNEQAGWSVIGEVSHVDTKSVGLIFACVVGEKKASLRSMTLPVAWCKRYAEDF